MKHAIIIALLAIVVLAIILGLQAFVFVFATVFRFGLIAVVIAALLYLLWLARSSKKNDKKQD